MHIGEYLEQIAPHAILVAEEATGTQLRCEDLLHQCASDSVRQRAVGLLFQSTAAAARVLAALDGWANSVVLLPSSLTPSEAAGVVDEAGGDLVLTDDPSLAGGAGFELWWNVITSGDVRVDRDVPTSWVFTTSGTTGRPKLVAHPLASLTRSLRVPSTTGTETSTTWGLLYEWSRFAGTQVLLQSLLSGARLAVPDRQQPATMQVRFLARSGCTHLSCTPTLWRRLLMTPGVDELALQQITLGGEIADQGVLDALRQRFPQANLTHIFASTEAGAAFSVKDGLEGFPVSFLHEPPRGIELQVRDGRLHIRNPLVQRQYLGGGAAFGDDEGFVDTGDLVEERDDRIVFLGRASGQINVGGDKVSPELVERVLLEVPSVLGARVRAKPNPLSGSVVTADIVVDAGGAAKSDILRHCRSRLPRYAVPATIRFVDELPTSAAGKVIRT